MSTSCKGHFFRGYNNVFTQKMNLHQKKGLRLLKRKSCKGCDRCGGLKDEFSEVFSNLLEMQEIKDGALYELITIWHPGPYEYPQDGDLEIFFREVPE